ncbi:restriction endonuclease subunit S [Streptococcus suis]|uniref:restriction endonuclease subunit S n=1 Tax=Streptococcus suis TaxID=1307 RepID=UPI00041859F0|nr:restriction endonuclease subunit S [Streptococcus suis]
MPNKEKNIPKRRFKEFENADAWELRKLGEVAEIIGGGTPSTSNSEFWDGDIDWYTPAEIGEQIYVDGSERKITQLGLDKSSATLLPANKTILFTSRAGIGKTAILRSDATTNQGFQSIVVDNNTEPYFIFSMTDKIKNKAISVASGSTFAEISSRALGQLEFMFPSINEQSAIGTFFSTLDRHITLHQRKLDKLKSVKQAYLSEMFPAEGERVPKRRFPGFTDDWELRKLGELGTLKNGMNFSKDAMGTGFPFINLQNIFGKNVVDISQLGLAMASSIQLKNYNLQKGDVLFVRSSVKLEGVGEAAIVPKNLEDTTYSGFIIRYRDSFGMDNNFKRYTFGTNNIRNQIMSQATDSANKNISQQVLAELDILVPSLPEQEAIGTFFSTLDRHITLHQRKLEKLKNLKKALLNELFV